MKEGLNIKEPLPLRRDLMDSYRRSSFFGWGVSFILLIIVIGLSLFIAFRPAPLMGVDEYGEVVGRVIFDEPRLRGADEVLGDMKNLVSRCLTQNKISVWEDMAICINHMKGEISEKLMASYSESGRLQQIELLGCSRVDFKFEDETGITRFERGDYFVEGKFLGSVICLDNVSPEGIPNSEDKEDFSIKLSVVLIPKTEEKPLGIEVVSYED